MEKVRLGRTNLSVTKLGWGGIPIQQVGEEDGVAVIKAVINMGVDFLDTARGYTNSEHRVGLALQEAGPAPRFVLSAPDIGPIPGSEALERARENWEIFSKQISLTEKDKEY